MKKSCRFLLSATRVLVAALLGALALQVHAAAVVSLKGTTQETRQNADAELRLSVLGFNDAAATSTFIERLREYQVKQDHTAFDKFIKEQQTRGYVFTQEATGYSIKYAWKDPTDSGRMVFVVTPALKTLNPYLWSARNDSATPFTVLEARTHDGDVTLKTSLESAVEVMADDSGLQLLDYDTVAPFAILQDDRPYYLKQGS